jgi:hypothetical protein
VLNGVSAELRHYRAESLRGGVQVVILEKVGTLWQ